MDLQGDLTDHRPVLSFNSPQYLELSPLHIDLQIVDAFPPLLTDHRRERTQLAFMGLTHQVFVHQGLETDKPGLARVRTCAAFVLVSAVTFGLGVPRLMEPDGSVLVVLRDVTDEQENPEG